MSARLKLWFVIINAPTRHSVCFAPQGNILLGLDWRLGSESNRRTRSCSPLHNHSATEPGRRIGAGNRVRTGDLNLGKVALYQLSYSRTSTFKHRRGRRNRRGCAPRHNSGKVALYQREQSRR